jgi:predicted acylesterase/phospholipase RssA
MAQIVHLIGALCVIALMGFISRNYTPLGRCYTPIGGKLTGSIDQTDPTPFVKLQLGKTMVGLSCSGGGSRAAYFAAAVLSEIHRRSLVLQVEKQSDAHTDLLTQIDAVSSVSGGSLAAAYFAANRASLESAKPDLGEWKQYLDKMATSYRRREWNPIGLCSPTVLFKLLFTNYNRGLRTRDDYDETMFDGRGATLASLPSQPSLYINSFDVANHVRFVLSKTYIRTDFYQPHGAGNVLRAPQEITSENDLCYCRVDPGSIKIADAVYASSAFPVAYPNLAMNHFGDKILFQGGQIFLADGGLADNSGLMTLLTQMKANFDDETKGRLLLVIYIDASLENIDSDGTEFQHKGIEDKYAWHDTFIGHGIQSIDSSNEMVQDLVWKYVESIGVVTDQINTNWPLDLQAKLQASSRNSKASWDGPFASGAIALRPCIIRLGLRDLSNPEFQTSYSRFLDYHDTRLQRLLMENGFKELGEREPAPGLPERLQRIETDFALSTDERHTLDLAAYLLVNGKLAGDLEHWSNVAKTVVAKTDTTH